MRIKLSCDFSENGEEYDEVNQKDVSKIVDAAGTSYMFTTGMGRNGVEDAGMYQETIQTKTLEYQRPSLGLEMKVHPKAEDVINKISFKIYPEMRELYDYYKRVDQEQRRLLLGVINDIRSLKRQ